MARNGSIDALSFFLATLVASHCQLLQLCLKPHPQLVSGMLKQ